MFYADDLHDVIGSRFKGQDLTFVLMNYEKISGKDEATAQAYIHKQDPRIAIGGCRGRQGFEEEVEDRRRTYDSSRQPGRDPLVPVVVPSLPARSRGPRSWFADTQERRAAGRVNALEEQWHTGKAGSVLTLLRFLTHPSPRVRQTSAIAIGEYLAVIVERSRREDPVVEKAATALLDALRSEADGGVLTSIGTALGNAPSLTTPGALGAALEGRASTDVDRVAEGVRVLRPDPYRMELLQELQHLIQPPGRD